MQDKKLLTLALMRLAVGMLGEQPKAGWWPSKFCGKEAGMFLQPTYPRTVSLARLKGVTAAALKVHDEHIGVGRVYHLFRLPAELEEQMHTAFVEKGLEGAARILSNIDQALEFLHQQASDAPFAPGPVQVGKTADLTKEATWRSVAAHYLNAYERGERTYPYFVEK